MTVETAPRAAGNPRPPARPRWAIVARLVLLALTGLALVPSVLPFTVETVDDDRVCVPALEGWHADRQHPSEADARELFENLSNIPSIEAMRDPAQRQAWLAAEQARTSTPGYKRAKAYVEWIGCPGACVRESRHRLIQSAIGLGGVGLVASAGAIGRRRRNA